jgi:hypothetical protein
MKERGEISVESWVIVLYLRTEVVAMDIALAPAPAGTSPRKLFPPSLNLARPRPLILLLLLLAVVVPLGLLLTAVRTVGPTPLLLPLTIVLPSFLALLASSASSSTAVRLRRRNELRGRVHVTRVDDVVRHEVGRVAVLVMRAVHRVDEVVDVLALGADAVVDVGHEDPGRAEQGRHVADGGAEHVRLEAVRLERWAVDVDLKREHAQP